MECHRCGSTQPDDAGYCGECGAPLAAAPGEPVEAAQGPPSGPPAAPPAASPAGPPPRRWRRVLAVSVAAVVVIAALAGTAWMKHWPAALFGRAHSLTRATPVSGAVIRFTSGQGIILTGAGSRYRLTAEVLAAHGRRRVAEPVRWRSDDPAAVSVTPGGTVTAHVAVGSANITATAAGAPPQMAQVLVARPASGTFLVPTRDIVAADASRVILRRTSRTAAIRPGDTVVSNGRPGGGLLAKVISVSARGSSVTALTRPASLASAFQALSVHAVSAPVTAAVPAGTIQTTAGTIAKCTRKAGTGVRVSLNNPSAQVRATIHVDAVLNSQGGVVHKLTLQALASITVVIHTGAVVLSAAGKARVTCELGVSGIPVPTPAFLGPVELDGEVGEVTGVDASVDVSTGLTVPGPVITGTLTAADGIHYTSAGGWKPVQRNAAKVTQAPGAPATSHASLTAKVAPFAQVDIGVAGMLAGDQLGGISLAFTRADTSYTVSLQAPFGYLSPGYTGPSWHTSADVSGGLDIHLTGNLATLLSWLGVSLPSLTWTPVNISIPGPASPTLTVTASPGSPGSKSILLSASLPSGLTKDKVDFVQYPPGGGPGTVVAPGTVAGTTATGTWRRATPAAGTRISAVVFDGAYGLANLPYASPASPAPSLTPTNWQQVRTLTDPTSGDITNIAVSPDGTLLATCANDGSSYLWNMTTGQLVATITQVSSPESPHSLAFSPDGKTLAVGSAAGIELRDVATMTTTATINWPGNGAVSSLAFSPDGKTLAAADLGGNGAYLLDVATGSQIARLGTPGMGAYTAVAFSPDGKTLAAGADSGTVLWDVATQQPIATFGISGTGSIISAAFSPDGKTLATGGFNGVALWNAATQQRDTVIRHLQMPADTTAVSFSPDSTILATSSSPTALWAATTGAKIASLPTTSWATAFSPHGLTLITTSGHNAILWQPG
jgi:WD40 repeat protein